MSGLILAFWAVAALMGCWSFSLFVRSVSEILARKRVHLTARRSGRSIGLALVLMLVCAGVSVFAGLIALQIERKAGGGLRLGTPLIAIGGATCLFAACLIVWAGIGDRARGRLRCPKCWYNMSGGVGLQCPECGKSVKHVKLFTRAKRPKWAFVVAILLILSGWYSFSTHKMYAEFGYFGLVPTWFLMLGWEHLPNSWVYNTRVKSRDGCLEDRLDEEWTSEARIARFRAELIHPMTSSKEARWSTMRWSLLERLNSSEEFDSNLLPVADVDRIFTGMAVDVVEATTTPNRTPFDNAVLRSTPWSWDSAGPYYTARQWLFDAHELDSSPYAIDQQTKLLTSKLLHDLRDRLLNTDIPQLLLHQNDEIGFCANVIVHDTGLMDEFIFAYFHSDLPMTQTQPASSSILLGMGLESVSVETQNGVFDWLKEWIESGDDSKRVFALDTILVYQGMAEARDDSVNSAYHQLMQSVLDFAHRGTQSPNSDSRYDELVHKAIQSIVHYDTTGSLSFPLCRSLLITECSAPYLYSSLQNNKHVARLWLNYFAEFTESPNPDVRSWLVWHVPVWASDESSSDTDKALNKELNLLVARFLSDPDFASDARFKLEDRGAEHLIPEDELDD